MESKKGIKIGIKSLKGMFNGQASRVKHRFLGRVGEMIFKQGERALKNLQTGIKGGAEDDHEQRKVKNPLL